MIDFPALAKLARTVKAGPTLEIEKTIRDGP